MKIACVLGPKFEDSEFNEPYDAFRKAGHEVTIVGLEAGAEIEGDKGKVKARVDKSFKDVKADDFDALLIPGGGSPDKLRAHPEAVSFVKEFMKASKPVLAICHGPQLLLAADEYKNHRMTAWKTIQDDLKNSRLHSRIAEGPGAGPRQAVVAHFESSRPARSQRCALAWRVTSSSEPPCRVRLARASTSA